MAYTPKKTREFETAIAERAGNLMVAHKRKMLHGPLSVEIHAEFRKPKSWPKHKKQAAVFHTQKPDADNLAKSICDALEGIAYADDSCVCFLRVEKRWANEHGSIHVRITPLGEDVRTEKVA